MADVRDDQTNDIGGNKTVRPSHGLLGSNTDDRSSADSDESLLDITEARQDSESLVFTSSTGSNEAADTTDSKSEEYASTSWHSHRGKSKALETECQGGSSKHPEVHVSQSTADESVSTTDKGITRINPFDFQLDTTNWPGQGHTGKVPTAAVDSSRSSGIENPKYDLYDQLTFGDPTFVSSYVNRPATDRLSRRSTGAAGPLGSSTPVSPSCDFVNPRNQQKDSKNSLDTSLPQPRLPYSSASATAPTRNNDQSKFPTTPSPLSGPDARNENDSPFVSKCFSHQPARNPPDATNCQTTPSLVDVGTAQIPKGVIDSSKLPFPKPDLIIRDYTFPLSCSRGKPKDASQFSEGNYNTVTELGNSQNKTKFKGESDRWSGGVSPESTWGVSQGYLVEDLSNIGALMKGKRLEMADKNIASGNQNFGFGSNDPTTNNEMQFDRTENTDDTNFPYNENFVKRNNDPDRFMSHWEEDEEDRPEGEPLLNTYDKHLPSIDVRQMRPVGNAYSTQRIADGDRSPRAINSAPSRCDNGTYGSQHDPAMSSDSHQQDLFPKHRKRHKNNGNDTYRSESVNGRYTLWHRNAYGELVPDEAEEDDFCRRQTFRHCHKRRMTSLTDVIAKRQLLAVCVLCVTFMIGESIGAFLANSLALFTDVLHLGSDLISFIIGLVALWLANKPVTRRMSFGYHRAEVIGALFSVFLIWLISGVLCYIAVERIIHEHYKDVKPDEMLITASLGVVFNIIMGFVLHSEVCCRGAQSHSKFGHGHSHGGGGENHGHSHGGKHSHQEHKDLLDVPANNLEQERPLSGGQGFNYQSLEETPDQAPSDQQLRDVASGEMTNEEETRASDGMTDEQALHKHKNINVRAAFIHVVGDVIQSFGVLVAALIIKFKPEEEYRLADPICTFLFSVLVLITTITVLRDAVLILMEGVPRDMCHESLKRQLRALDGVVTVHSLHVWALTMDRNALSVHLAVENSVIQDQVLSAATALVQDRHHFFHSTIQVEKYDGEIMNECKECLEPK